MVYVHIYMSKKAKIKPQTNSDFDFTYISHKKNLSYEATNESSRTVSGNWTVLRNRDGKGLILVV